MAESLAFVVLAFKVASAAIGFYQDLRSSVKEEVQPKKAEAEAINRLITSYDQRIADLKQDREQLREKVRSLQDQIEKRL